ncbi:MAG TPA: AraC family transcriptional regulator [Humisphaera sp.]
MDVLAEVMALLRTKGQLYGRLELRAPFALEFPAGRGICLIVTGGSCLLGVDGGGPFPIAGGDFVFLPAAQAYTLRDAPGGRPGRAVDVMPEQQFRRTRLMTHGGGGPGVSIVAGCFTFASPDGALLVRHLPPVVHLSAAGPHATPWFRATLDQIAAESASGLPGAEAVVDRLAEVLFVHAMRSHIASSGMAAGGLAAGGGSWLRGVGDPQVGEALRLMHAEPARAWTVSDLADEVGMSRSAFADRFRALVGQTPLEHLTQWRMVRAATLMREQRGRTMAAVAAEVGYRSESSFGKVFRRVMGAPPGRYRSRAAVE